MIKISKNSTFLTVIIPWCNRYEIENTLSKNKDFFQKNNIELIIVSCGGDFNWLLKNCKSLIPENTRFIKINETNFNKSLALNIGAYKSTSQLLFFMDADIILKYDFISLLKKRSCKKNFIVVKNVFESNANFKESESRFGIREVAYFTELVTNDNRGVIIETNRVRFFDGSRSAPGLVIVNRENFIKVNGLNSNLQFWGWEDIDFQVRLNLKLNLRKIQLGSVIHLSHGDAIRNLGEKSRAESEMNNYSRCLYEYDSGNYDGTYDTDVLKWKNNLDEIGWVQLVSWNQSLKGD